MKTNTSSWLLPALLAGSAAAQVPTVLPTGLERVWAGNNGTGTGYATQNGISQNLYLAPFVLGTPISGIGFRRTATTSDYVAVTVDFEVTLSSTAADLTTLSATFANNLGADATVVFPRQLINVPARLANSSPTDFFPVMNTVPWLFNLGPNLLIQCKSYGTGNVNTWRMDRCFERTTAGEAVSWGRACSAATVGSTSSAPAYMPGASLSFTLAGAAASQAALAFLGFDLSSAFGVVPLPLDLGVAGMTGCTLLVPPTVVLPGATDATGAAALPLAIPNDPTLSAAGFGMQWFYFDPNAGNPLGMLSTQGRLFRVGPLVCPNRYVWNLSNVAATTGSLQAGGPVVQIL